MDARQQGRLMPPDDDLRAAQDDCRTALQIANTLARALCPPSSAKPPRWRAPAREEFLQAGDDYARLKRKYQPKPPTRKT